MALRINNPDSAFALGRGQRRPRVSDDAYLAFVRRLPCIITGREDNTQAAHVRFGSMEHGKRPTGAGEKPSDRWAVPLHIEQHILGNKAQHARGEARWWQSHNIDPLVVAALLYGAFREDANELAARAICQNSRLFRWDAAYVG